MPSTYVPVAPGINLSRALGNGRLTKKWVREQMQDHPEWDWRNLDPMVRGAYVNGEDAIRHDLTLQVHDGRGSHVAMVNFQTDVTKPFGYKAVVS